MNRNWNRHAAGGLPILSAAVLSAVGLLWDGAHSTAAAQTYGGASNEVIVNYDVLNALPGQPTPHGAQPTQPMPASTPPPIMPHAAPFAPGVVPAPTGMPTSALTVVGPDGRPITPIKLRKPGSDNPPAAPQPQTAAVTPPDEPAEVPAEVPMPEPTPPAPAPGVNASQSVSGQAVETSAPPAAEATTPAPETPAPEQAAAQPPDQPVEEQPVHQQAAQEPPAETPPAETAPAEAEAASAETEEQPTEQAAAEPAPEPDNSQPAPPIPQGGIRIVFPVDLNDVPVEANAALDDLAAQMQADENMRIQIMCYASGTEETESKARRKSLARCINLRQYLFKKDVRTTRMDVRALGLKSEGQPADRVDIVPANS